MSEMEHIQIHIEEVKHLIALKDALLRLKQNKDFQEVVEKTYLEKEALRLVYARANLNLTEEQRANALSMLDGIGHFVCFLDGIIAQGKHFEEELKEYEEAQEEIAKEGI